MPHPYIGRLAPSPTGLLYLGHAATFWKAFLRAREHSGTLLLRNEDLDPQRSKPEYVEAMIEDLTWLGIAWQPPMISQSERTNLYRAALNQLLQQGNIYPCTCSRKDLAHMMHAPHEDTATAPDDEPVYPGTCRPALTSLKREVSFQPGVNYRLCVLDSTSVTFSDLNRGPQSFTAGKDFGDFLVWRRALSDHPDDAGLPSYQLACVVDDAETQITEVVRGADLLKSTARQILLQRALNLLTPNYFHAHLLTDERGVRLAKHHDSRAIRTLRQQGLSSAQVLKWQPST
jgi:glutamyl/glutaminyl-tRNA synthetase